MIAATTDTGEDLIVDPPELPGLELKSVYRSYRLWTRFNVNYAFSAMVQADSKWRYRRQTHAATPGTVVLMEPGETHSRSRRGALPLSAPCSSRRT
jgi:hypothetical protein